MTEQSGPKKMIPPYLAFRTLATFLEGLKVGMPQRIDRSIVQMKSVSGTNQSQIMAALEYLHLIDAETGVPAEKLDKLVHAKGEERQGVWKDILASSYEFIFNDGLDLQTATARQLQETFEQQGVSGHTQRKAVAFFLKAAKEAGLNLSPHFKRSYTKRSSGPKAKQKINQIKEQTEVNQSQEQAASSPKDTLSVAKILSDKFPPFDPSWDEETRKSWFAGFNQLMAQIKETEKK